MLPINFLFLTVWPVVDMRLSCKSNGQDYPADVPLDITKVVELNMVITKKTNKLIACLSLCFLHLPLFKHFALLLFRRDGSLKGLTE